VAQPTVDPNVRQSRESLRLQKARDGDTVNASSEYETSSARTPTERLRKSEHVKQSVDHDDDGDENSH
jgi:hypothetical protein